MNAISRKLFAAALVCLATAAWAQDSTDKWQIRFRAISVSPDDSSSEILDTGTFVTVDSAIVPELDITYFFNSNWALEVIAATSEHDLATEAGALAGLDVGSVWVLPPTATLQYHFGSDGPVDFYIGAGVNYTLFYSYDLSDDLAGAGVGDIDFDNSFGFAAQIGVDIALKPSWYLNFDLKKVAISTDATLELAAGGNLATVEVDIDPFVAGVGVGYRF